MKLPKWINETTLYVIALGLALVIRLTNLGHLPLTDGEANWALQALDSVRGSHPWLGAQVGYVQLTSLLFFITSPSNLTARLWPALLGSLLVLSPVFARDTIGRKAAVILAFALALDPGLAVVSRQAGGAMLAIACAALALSAWIGRKPVLAGCAVGLAIMGGESFWAGLVALLITLGAARLLKLPAIEFNPPVNQLVDAENIPTENPGKPLRSSIIAAVATIVLLGSLFFISPRGLGSSFAGLAVYFKGWVTFSGVSALQLVAALLIYESLALLLGVWGAVRASVKAEPLDRFLALWALIALLLSLFYPSRQVGDLCWVLLPLLILAARQLERLLSIEVSFKLPAWGLALLVVIISTFLWQNLQSLSQGLGDTIYIENHWLVIIIGLFILAIAIMLVGWGWSAQAAGMGSLWGLCALLVVYLIFSISHATHVRPDVNAELWDRDYNVPQAGLLVTSLDRLSDTHAGRIGSLDVTVVGIQSPALRWALRNYRDLTYVDQLPAQSQPSVVITQKEQQPQLAASYRGEGFLWYQYTDWSSMLSSEYLPWFIQHKATQQKTSLVLWVRTDVFPDGQASAAPAAQP